MDIRPPSPAPDLPPLPEDPQARIAALLERMDHQERVVGRHSAVEQRLKWQKSGLRFFIGPFLLGQLFDLWHWLGERVDSLLWTWAEQSPQVNQNDPSGAPVDARESFRQALQKKKQDPR